MREWLALWKYRGDERLQSVLSGMLVHPYSLYREQGITFDGITYVPVSSTRFEERGFNQAEELAKGLGQRVGLPVIPMLNRVLHTSKQSVKSRLERITDLHTAFQMQPDITIVKATGNLRCILLVDDVYTTGSTLNQCAKTLTNDNQLDIYGLTWAR
jgi:competence protein ComFC